MKPHPLSPMAIPGMVRPLKEINAAKLFAAIDIILEIPQDVLASPARKREIVEARQIFMVILRKETEASLAEIGAFVNRDHATVLHAFKTVEALLETDLKFSNKYEAIQKLCEGNVNVYNVKDKGTYTVGSFVSEEKVTEIVNNL
jgi:ATP-dependent RNA circularization protein (DNA/RNA ligase family)